MIERQMIEPYNLKDIRPGFDKEYDGYDKDRVRKVLNHTSNDLNYM